MNAYFVHFRQWTRTVLINQVAFLQDYRAAAGKLGSSSWGCFIVYCFRLAIQCSLPVFYYASVLLCHQDFVDAPLTIPACFTKNLNIDWSEYQVNTCLLQLSYNRKEWSNMKVLLHNSLGTTIITHLWLFSLNHPQPPQ